MRCLQICPNPFPALGGPAKTYRQLHEAVGAATVAFVAPTDGAGAEPVVPLTVQVRTAGGPLDRYYYAPRRRLGEAEALVAASDLVFLHGLFTHPPVWAAQACRRHRIPYVVVLHGILDPWALQKTRRAKQAWLTLYGRSLLAQAAAIVCTTQREAQKAAPFLRGGVPVHVISWASEIALPPEGRSRGDLRRSLGIAEDDRVLVYLGRLHSMKQPRETVRLLALAGEARLKLLVIGPDEDVTRAALEAEAAALRWDGLRVLGPIFDQTKFDYLRAADAFISLSHRENFNYGLVEAMEMRLPPILSPGNDLGWDFADEGFSWQLRTDDPAEAARAVAQFCALPADALAQRGQAARDWARAHLSLGRLRDRLTELAAAVARGRPGDRPAGT